MALHFIGILMGSGRSLACTSSSAAGVDSSHSVHSSTSSPESSDGMVDCTLRTLLMMWCLSNRSAPGSPCFPGSGWDAGQDVQSMCGGRDVAGRAPRPARDDLGVEVHLRAAKASVEGRTNYHRYYRYNYRYNYQ